MPLLDLREATFRRGASVLLRPVTLYVNAGQRAELVCESNSAAGIAARMASGIVKCTAGLVFVADFDPKVQPAQVKRAVGFVPHVPPRNPFGPQAYFAYRAAMWGLDARGAVPRGMDLLARLDGLSLDDALSVAGAFLHEPSLIVMERPVDAVRDAAQAILRADAGLFATYGPADRMNVALGAEPASAVKTS